MQFSSFLVYIQSYATVTTNSTFSTLQKETPNHWQAALSLNCHTVILPPLHLCRGSSFSLPISVFCRKGIGEESTVQQKYTVSHYLNRNIIEAAANIFLIVNISQSKQVKNTFYLVQHLKYKYRNYQWGVFLPFDPPTLLMPACGSLGKPSLISLLQAGPLSPRLLITAFVLGPLQHSLDTQVSRWCSMGSVEIPRQTESFAWTVL